MGHLVRALTLLGVLGFLALAGLIGKAWWDSRLPGTFNAMDMGVLDNGGGRPQNHAQHPHLSVDRLAGPKAGDPDFRLTLTAAKTGDSWSFNGQVPGPEIRVRQGDVVEI
jgi:FtsP/CotA-like multicopper oxidase with cupredoxin domain